MLFDYRAAAADGAVAQGQIEAADEGAAVRRVQAMGLIPIQVKHSRGGTAQGASSRLFTPVFGPRGAGREAVAAMTRELATLLRSGLPLDRALEILIGMASADAMRTMLARIREDVRGGAPLSRALEAHPAQFDRFFVGMVRAGEAGGALGLALERISEHMERAKELRDTVISALIYPAILVLASVTSVLLLLIFVVPQFTELFAQSGKALPLPTLIVIRAGEWLRAWWWALPLGALLVWRYAVWTQQDVERKRAWDARLLRLPLAGDLAMKVEVARFARTLSTLLTNGMPLLAAMGIVIETIGNRVVVEGLGTAREQLQAGRGLSKPLLEQGVFPPLAVHMIGVGEETGRLDEMLQRIANVYDREVSTAVKRLLALLEPVMILGLGLVIGGIIISILMAILKVNSLVG